MIKVGDTVKVIGTTMCVDVEEECIKIGTICKVVETEDDKKGGLIVAIIPERELPYEGYGEYWYFEKDVEKGHMEWVKD